MQIICLMLDRIILKHTGVVWVTTIEALIAVATLLLGAAKFATTAGPLGTWYAGVCGTTGVVNVIWVGLWTVILPDPCVWDCPAKLTILYSV